MNYDMSEFDKLVEEGYIRKVEKGDLILYNYTDKTTYARHWNDYTKAARGIILEKSTSKLVAKTFPKFFNLGEIEETFLPNLPDATYDVYEKVDGSLGIIFHYNGEWHVATRGSFTSEQAKKGLEILRSQYKMACLSPDTTYLVEIVYPDNKIVVNYGNEEKLVLLGAYIGSSELSFEDVKVAAAYLGMPIVKQYNYTINEMIELQKTMPKDQEGFVVKFRNGLRVKIKGEEYLKIHKMISNMSPLSFWEVMVNGVVNREYIMQLPEEFRSDFEPILESLEAQYRKVMLEIDQDLLKLPQIDITTREGKKTIGLFLQSENNLNHSGAMFGILLNQPESVNKYIMKLIRPTGNNLVS